MHPETGGRGHEPNGLGNNKEGARVRVRLLHQKPKAPWLVSVRRNGHLTSPLPLLQYHQTTHTEKKQMRVPEKTQPGDGWCKARYVLRPCLFRTTTHAHKKQMQIHGKLYHTKILHHDLCASSPGRRGRVSVSTRVLLERHYRRLGPALMVCAH